MGSFQNFKMDRTSNVVSKMKKISKTSKKSKISKTSKDNESTNKPRMSSKQERIASKMESILEDLPPDNNTEPNSGGNIVNTLKSGLATKKAARTFNEKIGKVKRLGKITE